MVPTLNDGRGIGRVLKDVPKDIDVLVVDGGSTDGTVGVARRYRVRVISQQLGRGKGCGARTGMDFFLSSKYDFLCMIDGNGSNGPEELPRMIGAMKDEKAEVVLGSRVRGKREKGAMPLSTIFFNIIVSLFLGLRFLRFFTDVQTGYWAFSRKAVEILFDRLKAKGFEIEMEIFVLTLGVGLKCIEVPVGFRKRLGETKFRFSLRFRNFGHMIYYWLRSFF